MGSFNVTCALSGLPITDGTSVRAIVLFRPNTEADHGLLYPSSFFTPASLPMRGIYSGYGGVKKLQTGPLAQTALTAFFDGIDSEAAAEQVVDSLRFKPANASITLYNRAVDGKLHLALIREDVFEMASTLGIDFRKGDLTQNKPLLNDKSILDDLISLGKRERELNAVVETDNDLDAQVRKMLLQLKKEAPLKTPLGFVQQNPEGDMTAAAFEAIH